MCNALHGFNNAFTPFDVGTSLIGEQDMRRIKLPKHRQMIILLPGSERSVWMCQSIEIWTISGSRKLRDPCCNWTGKTPATKKRGCTTGYFAIFLDCLHPLWFLVSNALTAFQTLWVAAAAGKLPLLYYSTIYKCIASVQAYYPRLSHVWFNFGC